MKNLKTILLLVFTVIAVRANATEYIIIRGGLGAYRLVYVNKPKSLAHWHYDNNTDTYYRSRSMAGIPLPVHVPVKAAATQYVVIKPDFWWGVRLAYVNKPENLKKWYYDTKSNTYYRGIEGFGIPMGVIPIDRRGA